MWGYFRFPDVRSRWWLLLLVVPVVLIFLVHLEDERGRSFSLALSIASVTLWIFLAGVSRLQRSEQHDMLIQKRKNGVWTGEKPQNQERIAEVDAEYILGDDGELIEIRGEHFRSQPHG